MTFEKLAKCLVIASIIVAILVLKDEIFSSSSYQLRIKNSKKLTPNSAPTPTSTQKRTDSEFICDYDQTTGCLHPIPSNLVQPYSKSVSRKTLVSHLLKTS